ncbi:hypothetical protein TPS_00098 [Trichinella pseudospiralis]
MASDVEKTLVSETPTVICNHCYIPSTLISLVHLFYVLHNKANQTLRTCVTTTQSIQHGYMRKNDKR